MPNFLQLYKVIYKLNAFISIYIIFKTTILNKISNITCTEQYYITAY